MKTFTATSAAISVAAISSALAGTTSKEVMSPPPAPVSVGGWFLGGTFGQFSTDSNLGDYFDNDFYDDDYYGEGLELSSIKSDGFDDLGDFDGFAPSLLTDIDVEDVDFNMYTFHVGRDLGEVIGCDMAAYLEVGYFDGDMTVNATGRFFQSGEGTFNTKFSEDFDFDIIPVTLNFKLERQLFGPVSAYLSAGAGYAFTRTEFAGDSNRDGGFYAQGSFGLLYNINESFEVYGGGRWVHLESLDFDDTGFELDDALAWEAGVRYNF